MVSGMQSLFSQTGLTRSLVFLLIWLLIGDSVSGVAGLPSQSTGKSSPSGKITEAQRIAHVLTRLGFGPRPGDFERVKTMGLAAYIDQQLAFDSIDDSALTARLGKLSTLAMITPTVLERYNPPKPPPPPPTPVQPALKAEPAKSETPGMKPEPSAPDKTPPKPQTPTTAIPPKPPEKPAPNPQDVVVELQRAAFLRAVYSDRQLYELMVNFWENHFSIYIQKDSNRFLMTSFDRDTIRPFALGRFRDLLGATAHSPAMLFYLDNWQSRLARTAPATKDTPAKTTGGINENYARELLELHTLGVDGGYTQKDVQEVARCLTGWTIHKPNEQGLFVFNPGMHDYGEKMVLGQRIPAGGGLSDGERVLDILAHHPSTARFIATKLARRFVSDEPSKSLIDRVAAVFLKTDGSIRETLRSILTSPEFYAGYRSKVKTPFEYAVSAIRLLEAETDGDRPLLDWVARMGQPVFGKLTPNGYGDHASDWLSDAALLERFNFTLALTKNQIKGTKVDLSKLLSGVDFQNPQTATTQIIALTFHGTVQPQTREAIQKAIASLQPSPPTALQPPGGVKHILSKEGAKPIPAPASGLDQLMALVIAAPEFQQR